jgi:ferredoxin--NADP+ reductase
MNSAPDLVTISPGEIPRLREQHYNAKISAVVPINPELAIFRLVPDAGVPRFDAGQFFTLGLGHWEPRVAGVDEEPLKEQTFRRLIKRAYSASCSMIDDRGQPRRPADFPYLEFYVTLIRHAEPRPPALTPRLFALQEGDRLFVSPHASGFYTLAAVPDDSDLFFFATGTGEAPHNAMIAELLARGHRGAIVNVVSVRYLQDAAYHVCHERLAEEFDNYRYLVLTTREPAPPVGGLPRLDGPIHLQDLARSGVLERKTGVPLDPARVHVFLCGSPAMIGLVHDKKAAGSQYLPGSMLDVLQHRGFTPDTPERRGNVHFERYW